MRRSFDAMVESWLSVMICLQPAQVIVCFPDVIS